MLKAPPPYIKVAFLKVQCSQLSPSNPIVMLPPNVLSALLELRGGTTGTRPLPITVAGTGPDGGEDCAKVDVWIPTDTIDAQQAPTINDPNASITLDITPSSTRDFGLCHLALPLFETGRETAYER